MAVKTNNYTKTTNSLKGALSPRSVVEPVPEQTEIGYTLTHCHHTYINNSVESNEAD